MVISRMQAREYSERLGYAAEVAAAAMAGRARQGADPRVRTAFMLGGVHGPARLTAHALEARRGDSRRRMWIALAINVALLAVEAIGGVLTGSLAVLADAGHLLSDVGAIALALVAARLASRPAGGRRTFGYQRSEVLAALVNGLLLVAVGVGIAVAAIGRLADPPAIDGGGVLALGALGLAGNVAATLVLARGQRAGHQPGGSPAPQRRRRARLVRRRRRGRRRAGGRLPDRRPDRRPLHLRARPRLVLAADQGALRRADGGGARRRRRRGPRRRRSARWTACARSTTCTSGP